MKTLKKKFLIGMSLGLILFAGGLFTYKLYPTSTVDQAKVNQTKHLTSSFDIIIAGKITTMSNK